MPEKPKAPSTLTGHAAVIWRSAFESAYAATCKSRSDRDACAAKIAWSAVKNQYKKSSGDSGDWVEKSFAECEIDLGNTPLPGSLVESCVSAATTWIAAYTKRINETDNQATGATHAWSALHSKYEQDESGLWVHKVCNNCFSDDCEKCDVNEDVVERDADVETSPEDENAEPIVQRSNASASNFRSEGGPIILRDLSPEDEQALLKRGYGNETADKPDDWPIELWMTTPSQQKTVAAVIQQRMVSRAYIEAAKNAQGKGWVAQINPGRPSEYVFKGWHFPEDNQPQVLLRAILVRSTNMDGTDPEHWKLRQVSTSSLKPPIGEARFIGPLLR